MDSKRIFYLDALRITAIFAMMLLHVSEPHRLISSPITGFDWQISNIYNSTVRFCVPVLIMISGVFFLNPSKEITFKRLLTHNILRIVTAFIFWSLAYAGFTLLVYFYKSRSLSQDAMKDFFLNFINGNYHMWFMFAIVGLYLITPLLRVIATSRWLLKYFIILSFLLCYSVNLIKLVPYIGDAIDPIIEKMNPSFVSGYTGYFCLGYYLHKFDISTSNQKKIYILAFISLMITIAISAVWSVRANTTIYNLYSNLLPNTFFVSAAIFVFFKYHVSKIPFKEKTIANISHLSLLTFGMYLVHDFFNIIFNRIGYTTTLFNPILSIPIITITVFICSYFTILIISKVPFFNKYVI